ncbi:MAG: hypothetical protein U1F16_04490 [Turneriella sp.]
MPAALAENGGGFALYVLRGDNLILPQIFPRHCDRDLVLIATENLHTGLCQS